MSLNTVRHTMPATGAIRKRRFRAALAIAEVSPGDWASAHGVSYEHLRLVLLGRREPGSELSAAIDATIEKHLTQELRSFARGLGLILERHDQPKPAA